MPPWDKYAAQGSAKPPGPWSKYGETGLQAAPSEFVTVYDTKGNLKEKRRKTPRETERWQQDIQWVTVEDDKGRIVSRRPKTRTERAGTLADQPGGDVGTQVAATAGGQADIKRQLAKQFGANPDEFEIGEIPDVGLVFTHPQVTGGELRLIDPTGTDMGDVAAAATYAPELAGEVIGGGLGLRAGPGGVAAGSSAGAAIGRGLTLYGLQEAGILEDPDILSESAIAGGTAYLGSKVPGAAQGIKNIIKPTDRALDVIDPGMAARAAAPADQPQAKGVAQLIDEGQAATADIDAPLTTGQVISATPEGETIGGRIIATEEAMPDRTALDEITTQQRVARDKLEQSLAPTEPIPTDEVGESITTRAFDKYNIDETEIIDDIGREIDSHEAAVDVLLGNDTISGEQARLILQEGRDNVYENISKQYEAFWENIAPGTQADLSGLKELATGWTAKLNRQIARDLTGKDRKMVESLQEGIKRASKEGADLGDLQRDLTLYKKQLLKVGLKETTTKRQKKLYQDIIEEIEAARYEALYKIDPDLAEGILAIDRAWATAKSEIDERLVGALLREKAKGAYAIEDDKFLQRVISNRDDLVGYLQVAQDYPQLNAVPELRRAMQAKYREDVIEGGITHRAFMRNNKRVMEELYTPKQMTAFSSANKAQTAVKLAERKQDKMLRDLEKAYGSEVRFYDPDQAVKYAMQSKSNAARIKAILPADEWANYQQVRRQRVVESLREDPSVARLDTMLASDSKDELLESLGPVYVRNLTELRNMTAATARKGANKLQAKTRADAASTFDTVRGMIYGPLDRVGFRINRAARFASGTVNQQIEQLIADPQLLKQALQVREATLRNRPYWQLLGALGFNTGAMAMAIGDPTIPIVDVEKVRELTR